jgi:hypothetical protein
MGEVRIHVRGEPHQEAIWCNTTDRELYLFGGVGAGKSYCLFRKIIALALLNPASVAGLAMEPTYDLLWDVLVPGVEEAGEQMGIPCHHEKQAKRLWVADRLIHLRSAEHPERIRALTVGYVAQDEAAIYAREAYENASARMRDPRARVSQLVVTTTHEGTTTWCAERERAGAFSVRAPTSANPHLPPGYLDHLRNVVYANDPAGLHQYLEGYATDATGNIYTALTTANEVECVDPRPRGEGRVYVGWDFNVGCMVTTLGTYDGTTLHIWGEVVTQKSTAAYTDEHAVEVVEVLKRRVGARHIQGGRLYTPNGEPVIAVPDASGSSERTSSPNTDHMHVHNAGFTIRCGNSNPPVRERIAACQAAFRTKRFLICPKGAPKTLRAFREHARDKHGDPQKATRTPRAGEFQPDHFTDAGGYPVVQLMPVLSTRGRHVREYTDA